MFQNVCVSLVSPGVIHHSPTPGIRLAALGRANPQLEFLTLLMGDHGVTMIEGFQIERHLRVCLGYWGWVHFQQDYGLCGMG